MKNKVLETEYIKINDITPDCIRKYMISEVREKTFNTLYNHLKSLSSNYPNFKEWFDYIVRPEVDLRDGRREIIIAFSKIDGNDKSIITGIAIVKKDKFEKKICAIRINEKYRSLGIGKGLFEACFEYLGTSNPMITIAEDKVEIFEKYIKMYNFKLEEVLENYYINGSNEYIYNGKLT
ncbi:hypothetical protein P5F16_01130 [Clostridium perfringens]|nr:hypothetical protein [Clostridium perfringens]